MIILMTQSLRWLPFTKVSNIYCSYSHSLQWLTSTPMTHIRSSDSHPFQSLTSIPLLPSTLMTHIHYCDSHSLSLEWMWVTLVTITMTQSLWWLTFTLMKHLLTDDSHTLPQLTFTPMTHIHSHDSHSLRCRPQSRRHKLSKWVILVKRKLSLKTQLITVNCCHISSQIQGRYGINSVPHIGSTRSVPSIG